MEFEGLEMGLLSAAEIRRLAVAPVTEPGLLVRGRPRENGVIDPRFGSVSRFQACGTCLRTNCDGHPGLIETGYPIPHVSFLKFMLMAANITCVVCASLLKLDLSKPPYAQLSGSPLVAAVYETLKKLKARKTTLCFCPRCGMPQPTVTMEQPFVKLEWPDKVDARLAKHHAAGDTPVTPQQFAEVKRAPYTNWTLYHLLRSVTEADQRLIGIDPDATSLSGTMLTVLLVPANLIRLPPPCDDGDGHGRDQHQFSQRLVEVVKAVKALEKVAKLRGFDLGNPEGNPPPESVATAIGMLYYTVSNYLHKDEAEVKGIKPNTYAESGKKKLLSVANQFNGKDKRIRGNLMGKRANHSARNVVSGGPELDPDEIGVPEAICKRLTVPVPITPDTRDAVRQLIADGKILQLIDPVTKNIVEPRPGTLLINGWVAERYLDTGDIVLVNRQPTLHRCSMMAHRVRKLKTLTFRLSTSIVEGYNADFDGDEIVIHVPQLHQARAEAKHLMYSLNHLLHPRRSSPVCGLIQDHLVGWYLMTAGDGVLFAADELVDLLSVARYDPATPEHVRVADTPAEYAAAAAVMAMPPAAPGKPPRWSGHQVMTALLPECVTVRKGKVEAHRGVLRRGTLTKATLGSSSGGIIHAAILYGGGNTCGRLLGDLQRVSDRFLTTHGFNLGVSDVLLPASADAQVAQVIAEVEGFVAEVRAVGRTGPVSPKIAEAVEAKTCEALRRVLTLCGTLLTNIGSPTSAMQIMTTSVRSKGSAFNQAQTMAAVGQTFVVGSRIGIRGVQPGITRRRRTLVNEPLHDDDTARFGSSDNLRVHGFLSDPFVSGRMGLGDFTHQAAAGREGLVDTSAKTPETGYIERQVVKCCENSVVQADLTVQDCNGEITQLRVGVDGLDPSRQIEVELGLVAQPDRDLSIELIAVRDAVRRAKWSPFTHSFGAKALMAFDAAILLRGGCDRCGTGTGCGEVDRVCKLLHAETNGRALYPEAHLRWELRDACRECAKRVCAAALAMHRAARFYPGEAIGVHAGTSCSEVATQIVLNTFHFAGMAISSAEGVPWLKQLMAASKNVVSITTFELHDREVDDAFARMLPHRTLKHIAASVEVEHDPALDAELRRQHRPFLGDVDAHFLRIVLDRAKTAECGVSAQAVAELLRGHLDNVHAVVLASRPGDAEWVVHVHTKVVAACRAEAFKPAPPKKKKKGKDDDRPPDGSPDGPCSAPVAGIAEPTMAEFVAVETLRRVRDELVPTVTICGVPGVIRAAVRKVEVADVDPDTGEVTKRIKKVVDVQGGGIVRLLTAIPGIRTDTLVSNDVMEVYRCLGVDCAAHVLFHELHTTLSAGSRVAEALVKTIVDCMTYGGVIMPLSRHGGNKVASKHPLAKASFEEAYRWITEGAQMGHRGPLRGVSERAMAGKRVRVGTELIKLRPATAAAAKSTQYDSVTVPSVEDDVVCESYCEEVLSSEAEALPAAADDPDPPGPECFTPEPYLDEDGPCCWKLNLPAAAIPPLFVLQSPDYKSERTVIRWELASPEYRA